MTIANVPARLLQETERDDLRDLGAGPVFASACLEGFGELTWREAQAVSEGTKARVLLFDLWVKNADRSLSELGGNPNLLFGPESSGERRLRVFDFHLSFDPDFETGLFFETHVFGTLLPEWPLAFRQEIEPALETARNRLGKIWATLPREWLYPHDDPQQLPQLSEEFVAETLARPFTDPDAFWLRP